MRMCISGGAPLPAEVKQRFEKATGAVVVEGYGLTESSGVVSCNPSSRNKAGTIGQPLPGTIVRLVDKDDPTRPPPEGQPGEIIFFGPQVMQGYWNRPDADVEVFLGKGLRTRSEEHTSALKSIMRSSYAVFCLKKKKQPIAAIKREKAHAK